MSISILDFGGHNDGTGDNGPIVTAALSSFDMAKGGVLVFPPGNYNFNTPGVIPQFVEPSTVSIEMTGAILSTANPISIFSRMPTDQNNASVLVGAKFVFIDGVLQGNNTAGQKGIFLGASYGSRVVGTSFYNLDVGFDGAFALQTRISSVRGLNNSTALIRLETGVPYWPGASTSNSQSNCSTIESCRDYCNAGQLASYAVFGSDAVYIDHCISEGNAPVNGIYFDDQGSSTVKLFCVNGFHSENNPTGSIVCMNGIGGGVYAFEGLINQGGGRRPYVDAGGIGLCSFRLSDIPITYAGAFKPGANQDWFFYNFGTGSDDINAPTFWLGNVPANLVAIGRNTGGGGPQIFATRLFIGSGQLSGADGNDGLMMQANQFFMPDDTYNIGTYTGGPGSLKLRPRGIGVGTGGVQSAGPVVAPGGLYIPVCSGPPVGVPKSFPGCAPLMYDAVNGNLYIYSASWHLIT
jgi:hypothetical protein